MTLLYPSAEPSGKQRPALSGGTIGTTVFRALGAVGLTVLGAVLVSCAEPAALRLSVHRSTLLGDHANPPLWVWTVDGG